MTDQEPLWEEPDEASSDPFEDAVRQILGEVPHPVNWRELPAADLEEEWLELNSWIEWLRIEYSLPSTVVPPYWHRHPELVWELSALHTHWQGAFDPQAAATAATAWHVEFRMARERLREWVALSGTKLDQDRPPRHTVWPGDEEPDAPAIASVNPNRRRDFITFVMEQVRQRAQEEVDRAANG